MYQEKLKYDWLTIGLYFAIMLFGWINSTASKSSGWVFPCCLPP